MEERSRKNYGPIALIPILIFLGLYIGCGIVFVILGVESPFNVMPRYVAVMAGVLTGLIFFERDRKLEDKAKVYYKAAGGEGVMRIEPIWEKLYKQTFWGQNGGPVFFAGMSAIDMALWDIKGNALNVPLHVLLGGKFREELRTYASQLQFGWGESLKPALLPEDYAKNSLKAVEEGYDCVKIDFFTFDEQGNTFSEEQRTGLLKPEYVEQHFLF